MSTLRSVTPMPAVVLDTNAILDWLVFEDPRIAALAEAILRGRTRWLASSAMASELVDVLGRPQFAKTPGLSERVLAAFRELADLCSEPPRAPAGLSCADPDDQVFIDLALAHGACWLVTRDKALLALRGRALPHGLAIGTPAEWVAG